MTGMKQQQQQPLNFSVRLNLQKLQALNFGQAQ